MIPRWWLVVLYGAMLFPGGPLLIIIGSSVGYHYLRVNSPEKAKALNRHAYQAMAVNFLLGVVFYLTCR